jgi:hypothetical protein
MLNVSVDAEAAPEGLGQTTTSEPKKVLIHANQLDTFFSNIV